MAKNGKLDANAVMRALYAREKAEEAAAKQARAPVVPARQAPAPVAPAQVQVQAPVPAPAPAPVPPPVEVKEAPLQKSNRTREIAAIQQEDPQCSICLDVLQPPIESLKCGHSFCKVCIRETLQRSMRCPDCRAAVASLDDLTRNFKLEEAMKAIEEKTSEIDRLKELSQRLEERNKKHAEWTEADQPTPSPLNEAERNACMIGRLAGLLFPDQDDE